MTRGCRATFLHGDYKETDWHVGQHDRQHSSPKHTYNSHVHTNLKGLKNKVTLIHFIF